MEVKWLLESRLAIKVKKKQRGNRRGQSLINEHCDSHMVIVSGNEFYVKL